MSTYRGIDNCTDTILDFLRGGWKDGTGKVHNMEAAGFYDIMVGERAPANNLRVKTLNQMLSFQSEWITKHGGSAAGAYQIIRPTLVTLITQLKFKSDTLFNEQTQDRLGVKLLTGRQYQLWWTMRIDDEEFAHQLSMEWASMPDPLNGGLSHYQGVGPNQAGCKLADVYAMLKHARSLKPGV